MKWDVCCPLDREFGMRMLESDHSLFRTKRCKPGRCRLPFANEHRADGTRAKMLEHKQPDRRGQIAGPAAGVDRGNLRRERHASPHRDIFQASPECVFETHAGLVTPDDHRSFDNGIFARGFRGAAIAALFALHE
jgi:hypothetical protein